MRFGTILVDPPWSYERSSRHEKLTGYADKQYKVLSTAELAELQVAPSVASPSRKSSVAEGGSDVSIPRIQPLFLYKRVST